MADEKQILTNEELARRDFVGMSVAAAGLAVAAAGPAAAAGLEVVETDVEVKTPDGTCDAAFFHPKGGSHPGVLIWPDAFGLRPSLRAMARRLAAEGYSVLVPNPFYRIGRLRSRTLRISISRRMAEDSAADGVGEGSGRSEKDAIAYIGFLDAQKEVNKSKKIGTQGYCMGGPLVMRTAATLPDRVGAGGSFHGGGLVSDKPDSPHLLAPKIKAKMYFGIATNDDMRQPDAKDKLKEAFIDAKNPAEIEVYSMSQHGWCISDMPKQANGMPIYNGPDAEKAWAKLLALYKKALA